MNKKRKIYCFIFLVFILVLSVLSIYQLKGKRVVGNQRELVNKNDTNKKIEDKIKDDNNISIDKEKNSIKNDKKGEKSQDQENNVIEKEEQIKHEQNKNEITEPITKPKPDVKPPQPKPNPPKKENNKEVIQKPWEELNISESDYYNKPMWKWARIDFSIDEFKTIEKTQEACRKKGEEYFKDGIGFSCSSINSYSGRYLGEMIKTF